jgi:hypothetical protein
MTPRHGIEHRSCISVNDDTRFRRTAVTDVDPKIFIFGGAILAIAGFFLIHPYMPDVGPLENAMIGSIPIGDVELPYRYVLVFATVVIGYGYYRLKIPKDTDPR